MAAGAWARQVNGVADVEDVKTINVVSSRFQFEPATITRSPRDPASGHVQEQGSDPQDHRRSGRGHGRSLDGTPRGNGVAAEFEGLAIALVAILAPPLEYFAAIPIDPLEDL